MSEPSPPYHLHRLNTPLTKIWLINKTIQKTMAMALVKNRYPGGVGICAANMDLIALVDPRGVAKELAPPFRKYELWQLANAPRAESGECPCMDFFDPEVGGPYRLKDPKEHHPFCQFEKSAKRVFVLAQGRAAERVGIPIERGVPVMGPDVKLKGSVPAQARPDEWEVLREHER